MKNIYLVFVLVILAIALLVIGMLVLPKKGAPNGSSDKSDLIVVSQPVANQLITNPVTITGQARGYWYFEASFPVKLLDSNGKLLAIKPMQAIGEWMTENFVPFSMDLEFENPTTDTGVLVLEKDNPSGLPEHDAELRIPVRFR